MPVTKRAPRRKLTRKPSTKTTKKMTRSSCSSEEWKAYNQGYAYAKRVAKSGGRL